MKAIILAAGRGKRMGPLTDHCPKPLLEYRGKRLIEHQILALKEAGFCELVINVSYLSKMIIEYLGDGSSYGVSIQYSYEPEDGGLETGGGVFQALPLLGRDPFVVTSADVVTDFSYARLRHQKPLHLVLVTNPGHHQKGDYGFNLSTQCIDATSPKLNYAGIAVMQASLFEACAPGFFPLRDVFNPLIHGGKATAEFFDGAWVNVGTEGQLSHSKLG